MKKFIICKILLGLILLGAIIVITNKSSNKYSPYKTSKEWSNSYQLPEYKENKEILNQNYDKNFAVKCINGTFVGIKNDDVISWKGIPFSEQPIGDRRFKEASSPKPSNKVFEAYHFGPSCMQPIDVKSERVPLYQQSEDCLRLNIWSNVNGIKNKPVLVFIHGGGWLYGGTYDPLYNGQFFTQNNPDIIMITVTYRMGMMGMINLTPFNDSSEYKTSINNGILDLIQSLRWIKDNIKAFGGDPNNITIAGEAAGGEAVSILCTQPLAKGLFQKAISMSGAVNQGTDLEQTFKLPEYLKKHFKISTVKELQNIDFNIIKEYWNIYHTDLNTLSVRDGNIIDKDPFSLWENGSTKDIIILQGHTANEFLYFLNVFNGYEPMFDAICEASMKDNENNSSKEFKENLETYKKVLKSYGYHGKDIPRKYMDDKTLSIANTYQALMHAKNGGIGYSYTFEKEYDNPKLLKSGHAVDLYYLFGNFDGVGALGTKEEVNLALEYQKMISNFAKSGNPSTNKIKWPQYNNETRYKMMIGDNLRVEKNPEKERVDAALNLIKTNPRYKYMLTSHNFTTQ